MTDRDTRFMPDHMLGLKGWAQSLRASCMCVCVVCEHVPWWHVHRITHAWVLAEHRLDGGYLQSVDFV